MIDDWGIEGKVAIVTGGGAEGEGIGNGRAAAVLLARAGVRVLVIDRQLELAERTVAMIAAEGGQAVAAAYNVTQGSDCATMVAHAVARWGRLDLLDNNVGMGAHGIVVDVDEAAWAKAMHVNLDTMFLASKHAIPAIRASGGGAIVNISSLAALRPHGLTPYSTAKGAVIALTKAMASDHGRDGIRVNCVVVGPVYTPVVAGMMSEAARDERREASVLGIEGTGWDVGAAVRFLLSEQARFITGQVLGVDGGASLHGPRRELK